MVQRPEDSLLAEQCHSKDRYVQLLTNIGHVLYNFQHNITQDAHSKKKVEFKRSTFSG